MKVGFNGHLNTILKAARLIILLFSILGQMSKIHNFFLKFNKKLNKILKFTAIERQLSKVLKEDLYNF